MQQYVYVVSDHGGFETKNDFMHALEEYSKSKDITYKIIDLSPELNLKDDYTVKAAILAQSIRDTPDARGFAFCSTGQGICMGLNRYAGIRAALTTDITTIQLARLHNDANVLCLPGHFEYHNIVEIVREFLETATSDEIRHIRRRNDLDKLGYNH